MMDRDDWDKGYFAYCPSCRCYNCQCEDYDGRGEFEWKIGEEDE